MPNWNKRGPNEWPSESDESKPADAWQDEQTEGAYGDQPYAPEAEPGVQDADSQPELGAEADILRAELKAVVEQFALQEQLIKEAEERLLRARAEMETMRRRMQGEVDLAREEGIKAALTPAFGVFDDLERALAMADRTDDPSSIVPGIRAVRDALLRNLASIDVKLAALPGEPFDPNLHEALTVVPLRTGAQPGTIDQVVEAGFTQGERLVRVARVTVFAD